MSLLTVFASVISLFAISCFAKPAPVMKPPACPFWMEEAVYELEILLEMQEEGMINIEALEQQLAENQRHCEALDAYLKN